jgi:hypothetical protein
MPSRVRTRGWQPPGCATSRRRDGRNRTRIPGSRNGRGDGSWTTSTPSVIRSEPDADRPDRRPARRRLRFGRSAAIRDHRPSAARLPLGPRRIASTRRGLGPSSARQASGSRACSRFAPVRSGGRIALLPADLRACRVVDDSDLAPAFDDQRRRLAKAARRPPPPSSPRSSHGASERRAFPDAVGVRRGAKRAPSSRLLRAAGGGTSREAGLPVRVPCARRRSRSRSDLDRRVRRQAHHPDSDPSTSRARSQDHGFAEPVSLSSASPGSFWLPPTTSWWSFVLLALCARRTTTIAHRPRRAIREFPDPRRRCSLR